MKCAFVVTDVPTVYRCRRCGFTLANMVYPPDRVHMQCSVAREQDCAALGKKIGTQSCESCRGTVRIKVFECAVHGKATLGKKLKDIACCANCPDYAAPVATACALAKRDPDPDDGRSG